jgi:hypothetical protein
MDSLSQLIKQAEGTVSGEGNASQGARLRILAALKV